METRVVGRAGSHADETKVGLENRPCVELDHVGVWWGSHPLVDWFFGLDII